MCFSGQCANSEKVMPLWIHYQDNLVLCILLHACYAIVHKKNFVAEETRLLYYRGLFSVVPMFCKRDGAKMWVAIWLFSLPPLYQPCMYAYTHEHPCSLFKT